MPRTNMLNAPSLVSFMRENPSPSPMIADLPSGLSRARTPRTEAAGPPHEQHGEDEPADDHEDGRPPVREPGVESLQPFQRFVAEVRAHGGPERVAQATGQDEGRRH